MRLGSPLARSAAKRLYPLKKQEDFIRGTAKFAVQPTTTPVLLEQCSVNVHAIEPRVPRARASHMSRPLIVIHASPFSVIRQGEPESSKWLEAMYNLNEHRHVIWYSAITHHHSPVIMSQHIRDLKHIVHAMKINEFDLCGNSYGAHIALAAAARLREHETVRKLVLSSIGSDITVRYRALFKSWKSILNRIRDDHAMDAVRWSALLHMYGDRFLAMNEGSEEKLLEAWGRCISDQGVEGYLKEAEANLDPHAHFHPAHLANQVRCPTTVIRGSDDVLISHTAAEKLSMGIAHRILADVPLRTIQDAAHMLPFERPIEWAKEVSHFLDTNITLSVKDPKEGSMTYV